MNYTAAQEAALAKFRNTSLEEIAEYSRYAVEGKQIIVEFLGYRFEVEHPSGKITPESIAEELPVFVQILVFHYLVNRSPAWQTDHLISYKELPGGDIYIEPFTNRAIRPLLKFFGTQPEKLLEVAVRLGGEAVSMGDAAVRLAVFPKVPLTLVIWRADDEFPASGNILFDSSAASILPTEDYAVLAGFVAMTLRKLATAPVK